MIIYNVTIMMEWGIHNEWLQWMQDIHIPEVIGTGCFDRHQLVRLLEVDETEGPTYAAQYYAATEADYKRYMDMYAPQLRKATTDKWGEKAVYFRSLMRIVQ
jgi:hypothetical protein